MRLAYLPMLAFLLYACTDENITDPIKPYSAFTPGSYWVYQWYSTDADTHIKTSFGKKDSVFIEKDTLINGQLYQIEKGTFLQYNTFKKVQRGSGNQIIDLNGKIVLSLNERDLQIDTTFVGDVIAAIVYYSLEAERQKVNVPAGEFNTIDYAGRIEIQNNPDYPFGTRYCNFLYAPGVGLVKQTTYLLYSPDQLTRELVRYHIEQ